MVYWSRIKSVFERNLSKFIDITKIVVILFIFSILLSKQDPHETGYATCRTNSDCESGVCIRGLCRTMTPQCGDGFCDSGEDCSNCERDCGLCKLLDGEPCSMHVECNSTICLHGFCRPSDPYHGDGWCESQKNETCWNAPLDCGECRWI